MSSMLRLALLAVFAAAGVGLAVWVATAAPPVTTPPSTPLVEIAALPATGPAPEPPPKVAAKQPPAAEPARLAEPIPEPPLPAPPLPAPPAPQPLAAAAPLPTSFVLVQPNPAIAQFIPGAQAPAAAPPATPPGAFQGANLQELQEVLTGLKEALEEKAERARTAPPPPVAAAETLPAPVEEPELKTRIGRVDGEGDDRISMNIEDDDIRDVLELISQQGGLNILPSASVQGKVSASLVDVSFDTALSAILKSTGYVTRREGDFLYVGTPQDFQTLEQTMDHVGTRVYRPNYVRASELQALITPMLTASIGAISVSTPSEIGIASDSDKAGGDGFAGSDAVVVRDYEAVLAQIDQVVSEVDRRPLQVSIDAMILSVKLSDETQFGVDFQLLRDKHNIRLGSGAPLSDLGQVSFDDGGLKFGFLDSSLGAFIDALETIGDTSVIASPHLMCLNKHRAEIQIGAKLGYISTTVTETSTAQSVEFLDVGTQLRLRPFVSSDGLIRMEVHPELSTGSVQLKGSFTLPEKEVTQVTTNIMVRDGCTMVIGGLLREDLSSSTGQIPFLGSLPGIGFLFRQVNDTTERREILVLITPHIVYDDEACSEGEKSACEFHRRQAVFADEMCPGSTQHIARKYFRKAQAAWAAGDREAALRFINLAIHFDPLSRAAIDLRADISAGNRFGDHTADGPLPPDAVLGPDVPDWVLEDLTGEGPGEPRRHPYDPGVPGTRRDILKPEKLSRF